MMTVELTVETFGKELFCLVKDQKNERFYKLTQTPRSLSF